jgi:hypothetical protein
VRYRLFDKFNESIFANNDVYPDDFVDANAKVNKYKTSRDLVRFMKSDTTTFYFIPETHPLFNYGLDFDMSDEAHEHLQMVIGKQLNLIAR